jgi:hypothetical protein
LKTLHYLDKNSVFGRGYTYKKHHAFVSIALIFSRKKNANESNAALSMEAFVISSEQTRLMLSYCLVRQRIIVQGIFAMG